MEQTNTNLFDLQIDAQSQSYLGETAKWAKFVAIASFIFVAIMLFAFVALAALTANNPFADNSLRYYGGGFLIAMAIVITIVVVIPNVFLLRFATRMQAALRNNDQPSLISAFSSIKSCYKFIGIMYIVMIALWILGIVSDVLRAV
jgi:hypothetical protein